MKKINMNDAIGKINDELIEKSIETDTPEKLKELKMLEKNKKRFNILKCFSVCASSFAVIIFGVVMFNNGINKNDVQIPTPIITVSSLNELSRYLGIDVSNLDFKLVSNISKYNDELLGEITYDDNSKLRISKGNENNSGIYGGIIKEEIIIENIKVQVYTYDDLEYAVWKNNNYSYSYIKSENEEIKNIIKNIIEGVK